MKKLSFFLIVALITVLGLTSCLEDSGNKVTRSAVGILDLGGKSFNYVIKTLGGDIYAPEFSSYISAGKMNQGAGYYISYEIDWDLPENAPNMVIANGYYTVTLHGFIGADSYYLNHYLTDTSTVQANEIAISQALLPYENGGINDFTSEHIFMTHVVKRPDGLNLDWNLSYDYEATMPTEENGKRYYDVFLRAIKTNSSDKTATDAAYFNSYYVGDYIKNVAIKEKELLDNSYNQLSSVFVVRINYVSEIKDDGKLVWKNQEFAYLISPFLSYSE